jgi:NADH-quinone oxidoreductase subunit D
VSTDLRPMVINMGPQHPSTHGVLRLILQLDGETVVRADPDIGYLHTGIEKTAENLNWNQAVTVVDRADYLSPVTNNLAYILAVEKLLGITPPKRAQYIRVILAELSRLGSHLVWLGTHALDLGAMSVFFYCFRMRERILDLLEMVTGARLHQSWIRAGGVVDDLPPGFPEKLSAFVDEFPRWVQEYRDLLDDNPIWLERLKGVARISAEDAINYGVTGPTLRGSGVPVDLRKTRPYSSYEDFDFDVAVAQDGDAYSRYQVRLREMSESAKILRQALDGLPEGPYAIDDWRIFPPKKEEIGRNMEALIYHFKLFTEGYKVPAGDAYAGVEGPRGEIGCYVVSDGSSHPVRVHLRAPSFYNLGALPHMARGGLIADVVVAVGSIDIVLGDVDR